MRRHLALAIVAFGIGACSSGGGGARPSTSDARVRPFRGTVPPEIAGDARTINASPTSLAALRGRVVFVQFAFPT